MDQAGGPFLIESETAPTKSHFPFKPYFLLMLRLIFLIWMNVQRPHQQVPVDHRHGAVAAVFLFWWMNTQQNVLVSHTPSRGLP
jgi:hypothetical protein